jgi:DNA-binding protein HU-beta
LAPEALLLSRRLRSPRRNHVTKAEFLDTLAQDQRIGNKKQAGAAVDAVLDAITDVLSKGGDVNFTGFGKFAVAERGPRQGVNPRTGERIFIPGGKVPRFSAGSGLKKKVKGGGGGSTPAAAPEGGGAAA